MRRESVGEDGLRIGLQPAAGQALQAREAISSRRLGARPQSSEVAPKPTMQLWKRLRPPTPRPASR